MNEEQQEAHNREVDKELWNLASNLKSEVATLQRQITALKDDLKRLTTSSVTLSELTINLQQDVPALVKDVKGLLIAQSAIEDEVNSQHETLDNLQQDVNDLKKTKVSFNAIRELNQTGTPPEQH